MRLTDRNRVVCCCLVVNTLSVKVFVCQSLYSAGVEDCFSVSCPQMKNMHKEGWLKDFGRIYSIIWHKVSASSASCKHPKLNVVNLMKRLRLLDKQSFYHATIKRVLNELEARICKTVYMNPVMLLCNCVHYPKWTFPFGHDTAVRFYGPRGLLGQLSLFLLLCVQPANASMFSCLPCFFLSKLPFE